MGNVRSAGLIGISLLSLTTPAIAQSDATAQGYDPTDDIIVEARRREERLQDVPVVISAVRGDELEKLNLRDAKELVTLVPGLDIRDNGFASSVQLRGLQFDITAGTLASVATYLNDAPINARAIVTQMYDIGQVEVLHGPQGTLRGQASPSGSITFTTRKPDLSEVGMYMSGTATTSHGGNLNGALNIPIIEDVLGVRVAGAWDRNRANRVRSISPNATLAHPNAEELGGRISVLFKPTDWLRLEGAYQVIDARRVTYDQYASFSLVDPAAAASPVLIRPKDRLSIQELPNRQHQKFDIFNWRGELRYAGQKLIYQGAYTKFTSLSLGNQDNANFLANRDFFQTSNTSGPMTSHEVRLQNEDRVAGLFDYVVGYYHTSQTTHISLLQETPITAFGNLALMNVTTIDRVSTGGNPPLPVKETSFFGNVIAHLTDDLQVSGGLRRVKYTDPANFLKIGSNTVLNAPDTVDKKLIYTASINYNVTPDMMVYASTGTSRRRGPSIFQQALLRSSLQNSFVTLPSEDSTSYEIGLKSEWLDRRLVFNITAFHQKFKNYVYKLQNGVYYLDYDFLNGGFVPKVGNSAQWGAAVPVTIKGVEAELAFRASPRFNFGIVAAYTDGKIKNGLIPCDDLNGDGVPDTLAAAPTVAQLQTAYGTKQMGSCRVTQRASNQSPFSATVQAEYNVPVGDSYEVFARGLLNYNGSSQNDPTLRFDDISSYSLLNLYAGLRAPDRAWEVTFYAKNVLNTLRYTRFGNRASTSHQALQPPTFRTTAGQAFTSTYSQISTTAPREFGVNLVMRLGSR